MQEVTDDAATTPKHSRAQRRSMPKSRSAEDMRKAEKEISENLPEGMVGEDSSDAGAVRRRSK